MQIPQDELKAARTIRPFVTAATTASATGIGAKSFLPWLSSEIGLRATNTNAIVCPKNFTAISPSDSRRRRCQPKCGADAMFTQTQKNIAELWILALSAICFILTLFSLVTFWAEPMRFGYPERPVLYLALCYNLLSVCYLERVIFHTKERTTPFASFDMQQQQQPNDDNVVMSMCTNGSGGGVSPCIASYIVTGYLTLAAAMWWLIFAICWWLSTEKQWSSEALEKKAGLFHIVAWVPALAPPIAALLWGAVSQQELTGMCASNGFVEVPALILLAAGAVFTLLASRSLKMLSESVAEDTFNRRLTQVRSRILIFSCVFFVPAFLAVLLTFFEEIDGRVLACVGGGPCVHNEAHTTIPTLLRLFSVLAGGSLAGMWVWSKKTCDSYRNRIIAAPAFPSPTVIKYNGNAYGGGGGGHVLMSAKKSVPPKHIGPLYAGINFHNVPVPVSSNNSVEGFL